MELKINNTMRNLFKTTFYSLILILALASCSSRNSMVTSFAESELGFSKVGNLLMQDEKLVQDYATEISKSYQGNKEENSVTFSLDEDLKVIAQWTKIGKKITGINYFISSSEILDDDLTKNLNDFLAQNIKGKKLSDGSSIEYKLNTIPNQITIEFHTEYIKKDEKLKAKVKKSIENIKDADTLILTHFDGLQNIPEGKIWILTELHRCSYNAPRPDSNNTLIPGKIYHCDGLTSDNYYLDLAINQTCMKLDGTVLTDGAWKRYPGQGITPEYNDPDIYQKVRLEPFIILYPGMNISVSSPDQTGRRVLVREIDIKKVKGLKEYIDFKNQFGIDKGSFEYISFMNLQFWEFEL